MAFKEHLDYTNTQLDSFANDGLRTLLIAEKTITDDEYNTWRDKYVAASLQVNDREQAMDDAADLIEWDFELLGATAIEDRLQDDVADVISQFKQAGIKVWVLTGDKIETAINIGYSCQLLDNKMEQHIVDGT